MHIKRRNYGGENNVKVKNMFIGYSLGGQVLQNETLEKLS